MTYIDVCQVSDMNNIEYIHVVWKSIIMNNPYNVFSLHLIHNIDDITIINKFQERFNSLYPDVSLTLYHIDINIPYVTIRFKHVTLAAMLRLYIPIELSKINKVLYLDTDILVTGNLESIWNLDCGEVGLCIKTSIHPAWREKNGYKCGNSGVMLMDLNTLRKNNFTEKCLAFNLETPEDDQAIINRYANGKYNDLHPNMNIFMGQDDNKYIDPIIYHLVGSRKPWNSVRDNSLFDLWHSYNKITIPTNTLLHKKTAIGILEYNTINLGDWMQTGAALYVWWVYFKRPGNFKTFVETCIEKSQIESYPIVWINRDRMTKCFKPDDIENVILLCNGWWMHEYNNDHCFIPPEWIKPIYISVHISKPNILSEKVVEYLKKYQPIGCRDTSTKVLLEQKGITGYFSGCLTMIPDIMDEKIGFVSENTYLGKTVCIEYNMGNLKNVVNLTQLTSDIHNRSNIKTIIQRSVDLLLAEKIITKRLHAWLPLICNNANVILMNTKTNKEFIPGDLDNLGQTINRFSGIVEVVNAKSKLKIFKSLLLNRTLYAIHKIIDK